MARLWQQLSIAFPLVLATCISVNSPAHEEPSDLERVKRELKKTQEELEATNKAHEQFREDMLRQQAIERKHTENVKDFFGQRCESLLAAQNLTMSVLSQALEAPEPAVRIWGIGAMGKLGALAHDQIPKISELQTDKDKKVAKAAAECVQQLKSASRRASSAGDPASSGNRDPAASRNRHPRQESK